MSLLHQTDVFQPEEKAARKHHEYGFVLALICGALALVVASVMFIDAFRPNGPKQEKKNDSDIDRAYQSMMKRVPNVEKKKSDPWADVRSAPPTAAKNKE